jgi:hypothetical protein
MIPNNKMHTRVSGRIAGRMRLRRKRHDAWPFFWAVSLLLCFLPATSAPAADISFNTFVEALRPVLPEGFVLDSKKSMESGDAFRAVFINSARGTETIDIRLGKSEREFLASDLRMGNEPYLWEYRKALFYTVKGNSNVMAIRLDNRAGILSVRYADYKGTMSREEMEEFVKKIDLEKLEGLY